MRSLWMMVVMAALVNVTACGPAVRCGAGTVLVGNECVAENALNPTDGGQDGGANVTDGGGSRDGGDARDGGDGGAQHDAGRAELPDGGCAVLLDDRCVGDIVAHCYSRPGGGLTNGNWHFDDCAEYGGTCVKNASGVACTGGLYSEPCTQSKCVTNTIYLVCGVGGPNGPITCSNRCLTSDSGYTNCVGPDTELCDPATFPHKCSADHRKEVWCSATGLTDEYTCPANTLCHLVDGGARCD